MSEAASPLPGAPLARRVLDHPPIDGARIKERPGDFLVEELPASEPSGEGDHLWLRIVKEGVHHQELVRVLCGHFGVAPQAIGWAGMKDRHAVTSQTVSVHLPRRPEVRSIQDDRIQVLWATWNGTKLRRGDLSGNRFSVRVRGIEPFRAPAAWRAVRELEARGVPNGFGPQRFGMHGNNHTMGALLLAAPAGCVTVHGPRTLAITREDIERSIEVDLGSLIEIVRGLVTRRPEVAFMPVSGRVELAWHLAVPADTQGGSLFGASIGMAFIVTGRPELNEARTGIELKDVRLDDVRMIGLPRMLDFGLGRLSGKKGAALPDLPLYQLTPQQLRVADVAYGPTAVEVGYGALDVRIEPR
jgi:hypothetical protein